VTRAATGTTGGSVAATASRVSGGTTTGGTRYAITSTNSKATYKVNETFINQGNRFNTAQGTTGDVTGDITINKQNPSLSTVGTIKVDISKLTSDSGQRDNQIRNRWLESAKFPTATFAPKRLEGLPTTPYTDGQELTFKIVGDLTIRTVTKEVTFDATGKIVGDIFTGTATTKFNMTDFGFEPPDVAGVVKAENGVELTMTIEAQQAP
jgi:polyisoprenoid-binding protein YceI